ncbi:MAG: hypothetical protein FJX74_03575 [Armatimonadetes bacterium]|nr:hypothetical protein [Armatimonadota bacterium]
MRTGATDWLLVLAGLSAGGCVARSQEVTVRDAAGLRQALAQAQPGARLLVAPGEYEGGLYFTDLHGADGAPITITAVDPSSPPKFMGGGSAFHFADVSHLVLEDLTFEGATGNGLNIDDGGTFGSPAHHLTLRRLTITDVGPRGNCDGIKLSGVDDFRVEDCVIERWGDGGSAIDMVGCHRGTIEGCTFRGRDGVSGTGPQTKGGTSDIVIRRNRFENAGGRAVNVGGSTGLEFFRPALQGYEARAITVEGNVFIGSLAAVAFVGVDGAEFRWNTVHLPLKWCLRILQETTEPGFVPCRNVSFAHNLILFRSDQWSEGGCNIGPHTAPDTFRFVGNAWYCTDRPALGPTLPVPEQDGMVGRDPQLADPENGDLSLRDGSPAAGKGHTALP